MPTFDDISKKTGFSPATISRCLNGSRQVKPATLQKVEEAARELGYYDQHILSDRQILKSKKQKRNDNRKIVFLSVTNSPPRRLYQIPALPALLGGIQQTLANHGLDLIMAHSPDGRTLPPVLARKEADGVLLFGHDVKLQPPLREGLNKLPCVWCFRGPADPYNKFDHVFYDNSQVGQLAADYLLDAGHRRLAFINPRHMTALESRREQFVRAVKEREASVEVIESSEDSKSDNLIQTVRQLISRFINLSPRPTGIFCPADDIMVTVFNMLNRFGIEPGTGLDLIGCNNDSQFMEQMHPRPATVDIKLNTVGERAVEQLLWRMSGPDVQGRNEIFIPPEVVPGEDVGGQRPEARDRKSEDGDQKSETPAEEKEEVVYR